MMEEVYIVKLKGLPPPTATSQESLSKDSKNSFYYQDLTAEAIRGFSYLHIFFGLTVLCLSVTNLCFHENPLSLEPPLGITVWCAIAFLFLGVFGIITAYKRRCDLSRSIFYVKIHFVVIIIVLSLTLTFVILFAFDLHGPIANQYIGLNIFFSIIVETVILILTLFTCARVLWPGCMNFCAKDWPMQPKLKRKVIVKTNVFANGIQQDDSSMIQSVGPSCVISLNMPPLVGTDSPQSASPSPPSSMPSPNCNKEINSSNLYSTIDDEKDSDTPSVFHNGIALTTSYPLSATCSNAHMQTFRKDPQSQKNHSRMYGDANRLLYEHSNLFKMRSCLEKNACSFNREYSNGHENNDNCVPKLEADSYDPDPYDTDEFDYCTTDDDEEDHKPGHILEDCHKSSSDEGNGTLEEDNKSSVNSDQLSPTHSEHDLSSAECYGRSISECDANQRFPVTRFKEKMDVANSDSHNDDNALQENVGDNERFGNLADSNTVLDSPDRLSLNEPEEEDDDEHDEGISSSGSSTCSAELSQSVSSPFSNRLRLQTCRSKQPYKSSIKIETNSPPQCSEPEPPKKSALSSTSTRVTTRNNCESPAKNTSAAADSIPTIRLLTTTKSPPGQPKQKLRIDFTGSTGSATGIDSVSSSVSSKLASHPYLCRLRANVDCFEKRYPKYLSNTQLSASLSGTNLIASNHTSNYHEPNRIPDIQRV